jgi:hypothetical protein
LIELIPKPHYPISTQTSFFLDTKKGFEKIISQGGFSYGGTIKQYYGYDGSTALGTISNGTAQVELATPYPNNIGNAPGAAQIAESQAGIRALDALHEILHLAGRNQFSDYDYANTVAGMRGVPVPTLDSVRRASEYWDGALEAACKTDKSNVAYS